MKYFSDPRIILHTKRQLFAEFFGRFTHLLPNKNALPRAAVDNDGYPLALPYALERPSAPLPESLLEAVAEVEALAEQNRPAFEAALDQDPEVAAFTQAVEEWLATNRPGFGVQGNGVASNGAAVNGAAVKGGVVKPEEPDRTDKPDEPDKPETPDADAAVCSAAEQNQSSEVQNPDANPFDRLARLSPAEYERVRKAEARRLHMRVKVLDAEVDKMRGELAMQEQAKVVHIVDIVPWPEPVCGHEVVGDISARLTLRLVLPDGAADVIALWSALPHILDVFHIVPRLNFSSVEPGCGKSTALELLETLLPRPLRADNMSAAVLFRLVHRFRPTMLLDELDAYLDLYRELRGLLNAGHKQGALAFRCEGDGNSVRAFKAFAPAVLAGLDSLPKTLRDRSILIEFPKAKAGQIALPFDPHDIEVETILARKLARWAADNLAAFKACRPAMPAGIFNRLADNWRPLFTVAQVAGGTWPARVLDAFHKLSAPTRQKVRPVRVDPVISQAGHVALLGDIRDIFTQAKAERLLSAQVIEGLRGLGNRPWSGPGSGQNASINQVWLARQLNPLGVRSRTLRIGKERGKGYELADVVQALGEMEKVAGDMR